MSSRRPFLLIEPPHKINSDDKIKSPSRSDSVKSEAKVLGTSNQDTKSKTNVKNNEVATTEPKGGEKVNSKASSKSLPKTDSKTDPLSTQNPSDDMRPEKTVLENSESNGKAAAPAPDSTGAKSAANPTVTTSPPTSRAALEDNIVLGVALEGSKRTLPIEDEVVTSPLLEAKELTPSRTGNGSSISEKDRAKGANESL